MKLKQITKVEAPKIAGYENTTVNLGSVQDVFGEYPKDAQKKATKTMRGTGAAQRGKTFKELVVK